MASTERLYYRDSYLREFRANVVETAEGGRRVYLDQTAFYPTSGGQPFDVGTLGGSIVEDVIDEEDRIAHVVASPLAPGPVEGIVDWTRRYDHMQQHTGQHLLSAVLEELFHAQTVSFHLGAAVSTIDVKGMLTPERIDHTEIRCAEIVAEARPITISFEEAGAELGLRKASERTGTLRIATIEGIDRSACGGTHLKSTSEIGLVLCRKLEKVRDTLRIEFVCGGRALRRAKTDYVLLSALGKTLASPIENTPNLAAGLIEKNKTLEKTVVRLSTELARKEGREMYLALEPREAGTKFATVRGPIDDATRARAQAFAAGERAVFLAICEQPPSILLAVSPDSGIHAGDRVRAAASAAGGRGGGTQTLAQGSGQVLEKLLATLELPL
jgi:alanyl-tRNA synthetase